MILSLATFLITLELIFMIIVWIANELIISNETFQSENSASLNILMASLTQNKKQKQPLFWKLLLNGESAGEGSVQLLSILPCGGGLARLTRSQQNYPGEKAETNINDLQLLFLYEDLTLTELPCRKSWNKNCTFSYLYKDFIST